jgi:hypothetical protein
LGWGEVGWGGGCVPRGAWPLEPKTTRSELQEKPHATHFSATTTGDNPEVFTDTGQWLQGRLLAHSCAGAVGFLLKGPAGAGATRDSLKSKCSPELDAFLEAISAADGRECSELREELHGTPFTAATTGDNPKAPGGAAQVFQSRAPAAHSNAVRSQDRALLAAGAWAEGL